MTYLAIAKAAALASLGRHGLDPDTVDEILQRCYIAAWRCTLRYDPGKGAAPRAFISRRVRGEVKDYFRSLGIHGANGKWRPRPEHLGLTIELGEEGQELLPCMCSHESAVVARLSVEKIFAQLEPRDALLMRLRHLEGRDGAEIAAQIGVSESRVSQLLKRAMARSRSVADGRVTALRLLSHNGVKALETAVYQEGSAGAE